MTTRATILAAALLSEGLLVAFAYAIYWATGLSFTLFASAAQLAFGAAAAIPLLIFNHALWLWSLKHPDTVFARFSREIIVPLCTRIPPLLALVVAVLSGFAEELLFRGALNQVLTTAGGATFAAFVSSALFAYVHFIGNLRRFGGMIPLYTGVGLYLWVVVAATGSLAAAMVTHGAYNFLAILMIRHKAVGLR